MERLAEIITDFFNSIGQTRSFGDVALMSGLPVSGHGWAIYEYATQHKSRALCRRLRRPSAAVATSREDHRSAKIRPETLKSGGWLVRPLSQPPNTTSMKGQHHANGSS
jgi:hypothetical protein